MRVLITGATGLIGKEIVKRCHDKNIKVNYLTTTKTKITKDDNYYGYYWNPEKGEINTDCFKGVEAIIHLVGASISKRWTPTYKKEILVSRTETTALLVNTLKNESHSVKQVVSASAIGFYPDALTGVYDESHTQVSNSFLGEVVKKWEDAVDAFTAINISVSKIRIGLVLSAKGGALPEIIKPVKFGLGAAFGNGKQWQSWIHIQDLSKLFIYVLEKQLTGIYNGVSPNPVTNVQLTKEACKVLKKPFFMPNVPKFIMKFILGEMHILLFESQNVSSAKIKEAGFVFKYPHIDSALQQLLG